MISEDIQRDYPEICAKFVEIVNSDNNVHRFIRYALKSSELRLSLKSIIKTLHSAGYSVTFVKSGESAPQSLMDLKKG